MSSRQKKVDLNLTNPDKLTPEQRAKLIDSLACSDTEDFIKKQEEVACDSVRNIDQYKKKLLKELHRLKDLLTEQKIDEETWMNKTFALQDDLSTYPCKFLGIGNISAPYCIGLQRHACLKANKYFGYSLMPDIGTYCPNAYSTFKKNGIGHYHIKFSECYDPKSKQVKCDKDGKPLLKDGDLLLIFDDKGCPFHCVRINVDKNGKATYTAGNNETISGGLGWLEKASCYIIPTSEIAKNSAKNHYAEMTNEELLSAAQKKGLLKLENENGRTAAEQMKHDSGLLQTYIDNYLKNLHGFFSQNSSFTNAALPRRNASQQNATTRRSFSR